jgi:hypothetical protein
MFWVSLPSMVTPGSLAQRARTGRLIFISEVQGSRPWKGLHTGCAEATGNRCAHRNIFFPLVEIVPSQLRKEIWKQACDLLQVQSCRCIDC